MVVERFEDVAQPIQLRLALVAAAFDWAHPFYAAVIFFSSADNTPTKRVSLVGSSGVSRR